MVKAGLSSLKSALLIVEIIWFLTVKVRSMLQRCYAVFFVLFSIDRSVKCRFASPSLPFNFHLFIHSVTSFPTIQN